MQQHFTGNWNYNTLSSLLLENVCWLASSCTSLIRYVKGREEYSDGKPEMCQLESNWQIFCIHKGTCFHLLE